MYGSDCLLCSSVCFESNRPVSILAQKLVNDSFKFLFTATCPFPSSADVSSLTLTRVCDVLATLPQSGVSCYFPFCVRLCSLFHSLTRASGIPLSKPILISSGADDWLPCCSFPGMWLVRACLRLVGKGWGKFWFSFSIQILILA